MGFCAGVCPFPLQIHLPPCPHSAQCPQRQTPVDHINGLLGPLASAAGSSGGCGREGGEWGQSWCQGLPPVGSQLTLGSSGFRLPTTAGSSHRISPNCHSLGSCTVPVVSLEPAHTSTKSISLDFPQINFIWMCPLFLPETDTQSVPDLCVLRHKYLCNVPFKPYFEEDRQE